MVGPLTLRIEEREWKISKRKCIELTCLQGRRKSLVSVRRVDPLSTHGRHQTKLHVLVETKILTMT